MLLPSDWLAAWWGQIRTFLAERLSAIGIHFHPEAVPTSVEKLGDGKVAVTTDKGERIEADAVMFGTGRKPNTKVSAG